MVLSITIFIVLLIVLSAIVACFVLEEELRKIVLIVLLALLLLVGMVAFLFFECQRKDAERKRDRSAEQWIRHTLEEQRRSAQTSWALTTPWRQNNSSTRSSTLPGYSPPRSVYSNNNRIQKTRPCIRSISYKFYKYCRSHRSFRNKLRVPITNYSQQVWVGDVRRHVYILRLCFSNLMQNVYYQYMIHDKAQRKTSFLTHHYKEQWVKMLFYLNIY